MAYQLELFVPDRFDMLQRRASSQLDSIVVPVDEALKHVKSLHTDMVSAGRGSFLIFRGDSGSGKSTFLSTLNLFLEDVEVFSITRTQPIDSVLRNTSQTTKRLRVIIIEGRDALRDVSSIELETAVHEINYFLRSLAGERTLIVWPVNADDLASNLESIATRVGGDALLGTGESTYRFKGPSQDQFIDIASRTIATLNQGASLADLGVTQTMAEELAQTSSTIGKFMGLVRKKILNNQTSVEQLLDKERCHLWIVVAAGNDPEGDVAALTRGALWLADIESLVSATNANIIQDLKKFPEKIGILGSVLRAKIIHLPAVTALSVSREYADDKLRSMMIEKGLSTTQTQGDATQKLRDSDLGKALTGAPRGTKSSGPGVGSNTQEAFRKLSEVASKHDVALNNALGEALKIGGLIKSFKSEQDFGSGLTRRTDLVCQVDSYGTLRIELMWRARTGRAEIANYALTKLFNYGRAIGFLSL